jgi:hypothetical protein
MSTSLPIELIEKQDWLEPIAEQLQPTIAAALDDNGSIGPTYANILHGTWLGHPLHAVLTDLPIGSWTAAAVFDLLEQTSGSAAMGRKADAAIAFGLIGATAAAVTGLAAAHRSCAWNSEFSRDGLLCDFAVSSPDSLTSSWPPICHGGFYDLQLICIPRRTSGL